MIANVLQTLFIMITECTANINCRIYFTHQFENQFPGHYCRYALLCKPGNFVDITSSETTPFMLACKGAVKKYASEENAF